MAARRSSRTLICIERAYLQEKWARKKKKDRWKQDVKQGGRECKGKEK